MMTAMKMLLYVLVLVGCLGSLEAQEFSTGLLNEEERYAQLPILPDYHPGEKGDEVRLFVDLKPYCPVAGNQGQTGSCVGWAVGYGAMTISRAIAAQETDRAKITREANSAAYVYNQIKAAEDCSSGAYIEDALRLVKETGNCLEREFNFGIANCSASATIAFSQAAAHFRIGGYAAVFSQTEDSRVKNARVCEVINANRPVIVGLDIGPSFWELQPGSRLWSPLKDEKITGKHAMVVVGYDQVEKRFTLLNSFGPAWGDNGFIQLSFADFNRICNYAYVLIPGFTANTFAEDSEAVAVDNERTVAIGGEFVFRRPGGYLTDGSGKRTAFFEEVATMRANKEGLYVPKIPLFTVGDVFQLVARNIPAGCHVYVFSQQSDGTVGLHFPKKQEADFMIADNLEIVIPGEETVLQLSKPGDDYLGVIYSAAPIPDIDRRLKALDHSGDALFTRANSVFADVLLAVEDVDFQPDRMAFRAQLQTSKAATAVGLFLRITTE